MKKLCILTLTLILALPLLFSCGGTSDGSQTSGDAEIDPVREVYTIVADGVSEYGIIRADKMESGAINATVTLRKTIEAKYGVSLSLNTDWSKDNKDNNTVTTGEDVHEILIGDTNRAETLAIAEEYADMQCGYVIKAVNGKIVIWGSDDDTLTYALEYFTENLLSDPALEIEKEYLHLWDLNGAGMPLDLISKEYSVIYASSDSDKVWNTSNLIAADLESLSGAKITTSPDTHITDKSGKEILVGNTDRPESAEAATGLGYMDYTVRTYKDKIVVVGGSPLATINAADAFIRLLCEGEIDSLDAGFVYDYDFDTLIADSLAFRIDSFVPVWANEFTPPAWMTDYEEKLYALTSPTGRLTGDSHRGDVQNYPENSLEGILSAIMLGADVIEIDIRLTKDNVMVLMHDASLKRTTNWSSKSGKNGLPGSDKIEDWTYEQLLELRLLHNGKATECKIPTVYEAALLFVGRSQIHFDCKVDTIDANTDVYLLAEATGSKESFVYYYGLDTMQRWYTFNKEDESFKDFIAKMRSYLIKPNHKLRKRNFDMITKHGDHANGWIAASGEGYAMTFTNKIYDFSKFLAANQEPIKLP